MLLRLTNSNYYFSYENFSSSNNQEGPLFLNARQTEVLKNIRDLERRADLLKLIRQNHLKIAEFYPDKPASKSDLNEDTTINFNGGPRQISSLSLDELEKIHSDQTMLVKFLAFDEISRDNYNQLSRSSEDYQFDK
jgi:hypothetical protein